MSNKDIQKIVQAVLQSMGNSKLPKNSAKSAPIKQSMKPAKSRHSYFWNGKAVTANEMNSLAKKALGADWKPGMDKNGFYPARKAAVANNGKATIVIGKNVIDVR